MLNRWIGMGRLTRDPELKRTANNVAVVSFTLAVDRDGKPRDGEKKTDFIDFVAWRQTAEFISRYFAKGRTMAVEGKLQVREYTDRDGNKRKAVEVVVDNAYFGDSKRSEGGDYQAGAPVPDFPAGGEQFSELAGDDGHSQPLQGLRPLA